MVMTLFSFNINKKSDAAYSEGLDSASERQMLESIEYVEPCEVIDLGFDPYFHLLPNFNAYEGMQFELQDIEYIEVTEELL